MSDYRYSLEVYADDASSLDIVRAELEKEEIIPHVMKVDFENRKEADGKSYLFLSTDSLMPHGSVKCWSDQDHELFFHTLSKQVPNTKLVFSGENLDDPNDSRFKKAFQNGQYKDAYQDAFDLEVVLEEAPWREYGAPAKEATHSQADHLKPIVILTCVHQTTYGDCLYTSVHPTTEAALAHVEQVKNDCSFEPELDEYFNYDIDLQVLDLHTMTSRQKSAHSIEELLANAEKRAGTNTSEHVQSKTNDAPIR